MPDPQIPKTELLQHMDPAAEMTNIPPERERSLRLLLDGPYEPMQHGNYEYALDSGLIDIFYFNPETGYDGIEHILSGNIIHSDREQQEVGGFHHEPSGMFVPEGTGQSTVNREHLVGANKYKRRTYREYPFEPYRARTTVRGSTKLTTHRVNETEEPALSELNSSMFPKEYDPLAVLQTVRIAYETRDRSKDVVREDGLAVIAEGTAPMIDNKTHMRIQLILEIKTGKVAAAYPETVKAGYMKLTDDDINDVLFGSRSSQRVE